MRVLYILLFVCVLNNELSASQANDIELCIAEMKDAVNGAAEYARLACAETESRMLNVENCVKAFCNKVNHCEEIKDKDGLSILDHHKSTCLASLIAASARDAVKLYSSKISGLVNSLSCNTECESIIPIYQQVMEYKELRNVAIISLSAALTRARGAEVKAELLHVLIDKLEGLRKAKLENKKLSQKICLLYNLLRVYGLEHGCEFIHVIIDKLYAPLVGKVAESEIKFLHDSINRLYVKWQAQQAVAQDTSAATDPVVDGKA